VKHHLKDEDVVQIVKSDRHQLEDGRGLHLSTSQLNLSALYGMRGALGAVQGVLRGV